jgi:hypothetical protein
MGNTPCEERCFPLNLGNLVLRVEATYACWLKHLFERLGSSATRGLWREAFKEYDEGLVGLIPASGWSSTDGTEPQEHPSIVRVILGSYLSAGVEESRKMVLLR